MLFRLLLVDCVVTVRGAESKGLLQRQRVELSAVLK